jgi:hypothetical protein
MDDICRYYVRMYTYGTVEQTIQQSILSKRTA